MKHRMKILSLGLFFIAATISLKAWSIDTPHVESQVEQQFERIRNFYSARFFPVSEQKIIDTEEVQDEEVGDFESQETQEVSSEDGSISATYNPDDGTITYIDPDTGKEITVTLDDLGVSTEWLNSLLGLGGDLVVSIRNNEIIF